MAAKRKAWESLSPAYRKRLERGGITKTTYERGTRSLAAARGHLNTPEHGITQARKNPVKYRDYLQKKERISGTRAKVPESSEKQARELNELLDQAYRNFRSRLGTYHKYNDQTVRANVYGGITSESGEVPGMSPGEARWTARADTEEIRSRASGQYTGNPWWYH